MSCEFLTTTKVTTTAPGWTLLHIEQYDSGIAYNNKAALS